MKEQVLMVWEYYDGVRGGIALYRGAPHYFDCEFDEAKGNYTNIFRLWPINADLLTLAIEQWEIYCAWELKFHSGQVARDTHPGHRGQNARYDQIQDQIDAYLSSLGDPAHRVLAEFTRKLDQPNGFLREQEVTWLER